MQNNGPTEHRCYSEGNCLYVCMEACMSPENFTSTGSEGGQLSHANGVCLLTCRLLDVKESEHRASVKVIIWLAI